MAGLFVKEDREEEMSMKEGSQGRSGLLVICMLALEIGRMSLQGKGGLPG